MWPLPRLFQSDVYQYHISVVKLNKSGTLYQLVYRDTSSNAVLIIESYYKNKLHGVTKSYSEYGVTEYYYELGKVVFKNVFQYETGLTLREEVDSFGSNNITEWYPTSKIREFSYLHGEYGYWRTYYENGRVASEGHYPLVLNKTIIAKGENSEDGISGIYHENPKQGAWKYWYENGNLERVEYYKDDKKDSTWYYYDPNGSLVRVEKYSNDTLVH